LISAVPFVMAGEKAPIVVKVRERLNIPGGNELDRSLMEVIRGVQRANDLEPTGELDERTLGVLSLSIW
jgi:hypothetical protein